MKRLTLLALLFLTAGCQKHPVSAGYVEAMQLLHAESEELQRAANWRDYAHQAFGADNSYPFAGENIRGIAPKTREEAADEIKKADEYLARQRQRTERARKARDEADG